MSRFDLFVCTDKIFLLTTTRVVVDKGRRIYLVGKRYNKEVPTRKCGGMLTDRKRMYHAHWRACKFIAD